MIMVSRFLSNKGKANSAWPRPQGILGHRVFNTHPFSDDGVASSNPHIPKILIVDDEAKTNPKLLRIARLAVIHHLNQKVQLKKVMGACREMDSNLYHIALETKEFPKPKQQFYLKATEQQLEQWLQWNPIAVGAFENYNVKEEVPVIRFTGKGLQDYINSMIFGDSISAKHNLDGGVKAVSSRRDPFVIGLAQFAVSQYNSRRHFKERRVMFRRVLGSCHDGHIERLYHIVISEPRWSYNRKFYAQVGVNMLLNLKQLKKWSEWVPIEDADNDANGQETVKMSWWEVLKHNLLSGFRRRIAK